MDDMRCRRRRFPHHRPVPAADAQACRGQALRAARRVPGAGGRRGQGLPDGVGQPADPLLLSRRRGLRAPQGGAACGAQVAAAPPRTCHAAHPRHRLQRHRQVDAGARDGSASRPPVSSISTRNTGGRAGSSPRRRSGWRAGRKPRGARSLGDGRQLQRHFCDPCAARGRHRVARPAAPHLFPARVCGASSRATAECGPTCRRGARSRSIWSSCSSGCGPTRRAAGRRTLSLLESLRGESPVVVLRTPRQVRAFVDGLPATLVSRLAEVA